MKEFISSMKKYRVLWIFALVMLVLSVFSYDLSKTRQPLVYSESLDKVIMEVQEQEITLKDFALYVAYEEQTVEKQAQIYNPDNPKLYWGTRINGQFVKYRSRQQAVDMALHDMLFYGLYKDMNLEFTNEEYEILENDAEDFWYDLTDHEGEAGLGVTKEDIHDAMYKVACAQKAQYICERTDGVPEGSYDFSTEEYQEYLSHYQYKVYKNVLDRIDFGNVSYNR